jgi:hypothetical protein
VSHLVQWRCQTDLVENLESGWMNRIAAEFAVEILVHFEERYGDPAPRKKQSKRCASWASANNAARSLLNIEDFALMGLGAGDYRGCVHPRMPNSYQLMHR